MYAKALVFVCTKTLDPLFIMISPHDFYKKKYPLYRNFKTEIVGLRSCSQMSPQRVVKYHRKVKNFLSPSTPFGRVCLLCFARLFILIFGLCLDV